MIRLFIVEDEVLLRHGIAFLGPWEEHGFAVVGEASNGEQALAMMAELRPDIVLTDIVMPAMDGIELTRRIKTEYKDTVVVILSNYDHFPYARKALKAGASDYVLKSEVTFDQMIACLKAAYDKTAAEIGPAPRPMDGRHFLYRLLQDKRSTEAELRALAVHSDISILLPCHCVVFGKRPMGHADGQEYATWEWLEEADLANAPWLLMDDLLVTLPPAGEPDKLIGRIQERGARCDVDILALKSGACGSLFSIRLAYNEALKQRMRWFYRPAGARIDLQENFSWACEPAFSQNDFEFALCRQDRAEGLRQLQKLFAHAGENGGQVDPALLVQRCEEIIHLGVLCREHNVPDMNATRGMLLRIRALSELLSADALKEYMEDFLYELWEGRPLAQDNSLVKTALDYVRSHYTNNITLQQLASQLHVNYCYLSRLFRQETGMGLMDTITSLRVEEARRALKTGHQSIAAVGQAVGYMDAGYFCRVFKKVTGLTPSEYRDQEGMAKGAAKGSCPEDN